MAFESFAANAAVASAIAKNKHKWDIWNWYSIVDEIAEGDRFTRTGQTKMEGAMSANFYEAMTLYAKMRHMAHDFSQT